MDDVQTHIVEGDNTLLALCSWDRPEAVSGHVTFHVEVLRMLTYAHVCSRMLTYAEGDVSGLVTLHVEVLHPAQASAYVC
jgi:hypothetical protein